MPLLPQGFRGALPAPSEPAEATTSGLSRSTLVPMALALTFARSNPISHNLIKLSSIVSGSTLCHRR